MKRMNALGGRTVRLGFLALALLLVTGSTAFGAKPERLPYSPGPTELIPGQACDFDVRIAQVPGSRYAETLFSDGRYVLTGSGHDRVTNLDFGGSVTLPTSGKLTATELANGDQRVQVSGRTVFYFYEGDQGPFGEVEFPGALYYIVGHVDEILDPDTGFTVTSFEWSGHATELCGLID